MNFNLRSIAKTLGRSTSNVIEGFKDGLSTPDETVGGSEAIVYLNLDRELRETREQLERLINADPEEARKSEMFKMLIKLDELSGNQEHYITQIEELNKKIRELINKQSLEAGNLNNSLEILGGQNINFQKEIKFWRVLVAMLAASSVLYFLVEKSGIRLTFPTHQESAPSKTHNSDHESHN